MSGSPETPNASTGDVPKIEQSRAEELTKIIRGGAGLKPDGHGGLRVEVTDEQIEDKRREMIKNEYNEHIRTDQTIASVMHAMEGGDTSMVVVNIGSLWREIETFSIVNYGGIRLPVYVRPGEKERRTMEEEISRAQEILRNVVRLWRADEIRPTLTDKEGKSFEPSPINLLQGDLEMYARNLADWLRKLVNPTGKCIEIGVRVPGTDKYLVSCLSCYSHINPNYVKRIDLNPNMEKIAQEIYG